MFELSRVVKDEGEANVADRSATFNQPQCPAARTRHICHADKYADGYRCFYCGMAMGFDLLEAKAALSLQSELKDLQVIAVVPLTFGLPPSRKA